jgi:hypothetical protein
MLRRRLPADEERCTFAAPRGESPPISGASDPAGQSRAEARRRARDPRQQGPGDFRWARRRHAWRVTWTASRKREIPRPSSRETAPPPQSWVSGREDQLAGNRLCGRIRKEPSMLSGPRRAQAGSNLPAASARDQRSAKHIGGSSPRQRGGRKPMNQLTGPRGDVASHFVGRLVLVMAVLPQGAGRHGGTVAGWKVAGHWSSGIRSAVTGGFVRMAGGQGSPRIAADREPTPFRLARPAAGDYCGAV